MHKNVMRFFILIIILAGLVSAMLGQFAAACFYLILAFMGVSIGGYFNWKAQHKERKDYYKSHKHSHDNLEDMKGVYSREEGQETLDSFLKGLDTESAIAGIVLIAHKPDAEKNCPVTALLFGSLDELQSLCILGVNRVHAIGSLDTSTENKNSSIH